MTTVDVSVNIDMLSLRRCYTLSSTSRTVHSLKTKNP